MRRDWIRDLYVQEMVDKKIDYYYNSDGRLVFTEHYLQQMGKCCGSGCTHCPYTPKHQKGSTNLNEKSN